MSMALLAYALPVGSGEGLATGLAGAAEDAGCADVGEAIGVGVAHAVALVGTGTGVADPACPPAGLALALGTGVGQDWLAGMGSGVAGIPVGLAEGAVAKALGVADAG